MCHRLYPPFPVRSAPTEAGPGGESYRPGGGWVDRRLLCLEASQREGHPPAVCGMSTHSFAHVTVSWLDSSCIASKKDGHSSPRRINSFKKIIYSWQHETFLLVIYRMLKDFIAEGPSSFPEINNKISVVLPVLCSAQTKNMSWDYRSCMVAEIKHIY